MSILSTYDVAVLFIATLKATSSISTIFGDEIRRANWGSNQFVYPSLRFDVNTMRETPLNGNCKGTWYDINASAYIFTEGASQKDCESYMDTVADRFKNAQISDSTLKSLALSIEFMPPISDDFNHWRGEVVIYGKFYEV